MKTMYYQTSHFICHSGNVVDLEEFRRKLALTQRDSLARQLENSYETLEPEEPEEQENVEPSAFHPVVLTMTGRERRRARRNRQAWMLDACASLAVILMTLFFALRVML
ncbi:MAG: hypothetical protein HFF52_06440 [Lawsonibacter sp.]|nr:hypothetical protein [Lawsonibacter sp.]